MDSKQAVVGYHRRGDGGILVVYNHKYGAWSLPGGKVEEGETCHRALRRELEEEIGFRGALGTPIKYSALTYVEADPDRMVHVIAFYNSCGCVKFEPIELNQPIGWVTKEFLCTQAHARAAQWFKDFFKALEVT